MTFEGGRKKQVLVLQPKGKALYEDDSSFGSKMLAKMGWNKGQGLGKEQHGKVDFIQIRYKNNANGLGYDGLKDNQWTENESQFDDLLKKLNGSNSNSGDEEKDEKPSRKKKSLEEQSKMSRARVHYKKFTRGKDVHKYSEKDLANILGKKTLKDTEEKPSEIEEEVVIEEKPDVYESNLIVNAGLSVTDYFKQKMQSKKFESFQYQTPIECDPDPDPDPACDDENERVKKRKRKHVEQLLEETIVEEENPKSIKTKSKKEKKNKKAESNDESYIKEDNSEFTPMKPSKKKKQPLREDDLPLSSEPGSESLVEKPDKKKKSKANELESAQEIVSTPNNEPQKKKSKKKREEKATKKSGESEPPKGANAVYSTNIIQIPSHVAQKMASMSINNFTNSNVANIIGYGLTEDIDIKIVQTKIGDNSINTDKYSLFNIDKLTTRNRTNPRKILSKIKRTKKSFQVI